MEHLEMWGLSPELKAFAKEKGLTEKDMKVCKICKTRSLFPKPYEAMNAVSRHGKGYICSGCGRTEAMIDFARASKTKKNPS